MIDRYQLPFRFDPDRLKADLALIEPGEWVPHFNRDYYSGDWSGVVLRGPGGRTNTLVPNLLTSGSSAPPEHADTAILGRCAYFQHVLSAFSCPLKSVRLLRLSSGSVVKEHRDYDLGYEGGEVRIHIPVLTNPELEFHLNNRRVVLGEGEVWYLDLGGPHRVRNGGPSPRIHLVVDLLVNDWLRAQIPFEKHSEAEIEAQAAPPVDPQTAPLHLQRFQELVASNLSLQKELREMTDHPLFIAETARLGRQHDCHFTAEDVQQAFQKERRSWLERWIT
jgi:Aspartyl/Asparaginyl beta-hydroxylase